MRRPGGPDIALLGVVGTIAVSVATCSLLVRNIRVVPESDQPTATPPARKVGLTHPAYPSVVALGDWKTVVEWIGKGPQLTESFRVEREWRIIFHSEDVNVAPPPRQPPPPPRWAAGSKDDFLANAWRVDEPDEWPEYPSDGFFMVTLYGSPARTPGQIVRSVRPGITAVSAPGYYSFEVRAQRDWSLIVQEKPETEAGKR